MRYVARDQRFCNILQPRQPHLVAARAHFSHHALHRRVAQECLHPFSHRRQYHLFLVSVPSLRYAVFPCSTFHRSQTASSRGFIVSRVCLSTLLLSSASHSTRPLIFFRISV